MGLDKYHIFLSVLLLISILFLGFSTISKDNPLTDTKEPEVWHGEITAEDVNNIAD